MSGRLRLDDIGFPVPDAKSYMNLGIRVAEEGESIQTPVGTYLFWSQPNGIEVWVKIAEEGQHTYLHGHFKGKARMSVAIVDKKEYESNALAEGCFVAYPNYVEGQGFLDKNVACQYGDGTYSGYVPFLFDAPDYDKYAEIPLPFLAEIQLTAFPYAMKSFESADAWIDWQIENKIFPADENGNHGFIGSEAFCPEALLYRRKDKDDYPKVIAFITGLIVDTAIINNEETGEDFCWAKVLTIAGELDVVAAPDILDGPIVRYGVITCHAQLSGRILSINDLDYSTE
ncbi:MAG TPA: hypothetical protein VJS44_18815 [Pyrinomonadaceae bacterium]|nr:hypothetical protein [Pyrinomonadaceae bacterium]